MVASACNHLVGSEQTRWLDPGRFAFQTPDSRQSLAERVWEGLLPKREMATHQSKNKEKNDGRLCKGARPLHAG